LEPKDFHPGTHGKLSVFDAVPRPVFTAFVSPGLDSPFPLYAFALKPDHILIPFSSKVPYIVNVTQVSDEAKLPTTAWRKF
jgi:hypothetical protein